MPRDTHSGEPTLFPNTLTAYRTWTYTPYRITALNGTVWTDGWLNAHCVKAKTMYGLSYQTFANSEDHVAPVDGCSCGIYGRWKPDDIKDLIGWHQGDIGYIAGAIEIKGIILPGYRGMRAQQARIVAICPVNTLDMSDTVPLLAQRYRVPYFNSMRELVAHFPPENLDALGIKKEPEIDYAGLEAHVVQLANAMQLDSKEVEEILEKFKTANRQYVIPAGSLGSDMTITMSSDGLGFTNTNPNTAVTTSLYPYWHYMTGRSTGKSALQNIILGTIT